MTSSWGSPTWSLGWSQPSSPLAMRSGHFADGAASPRRPWRSEWARASRGSPSSRMGLRALPSTSTSERSSPSTLQPRGTSEGSPGDGPGARRPPRDERLGEPAPARGAGHGPEVDDLAGVSCFAEERRMPIDRISGSYVVFCRSDLPRSPTSAANQPLGTQRLPRFFPVTSTFPSAFSSRSSL